MRKTLPLSIFMFTATAIGASVPSPGNRQETFLNTSHLLTARADDPSAVTATVNVTTDPARYDEINDVFAINRDNTADIKIYNAGIDPRTNTASITLPAGTYDFLLTGSSGKLAAFMALVYENQSVGQGFVLDASTADATREVKIIPRAKDGSRLTYGANTNIVSADQILAIRYRDSYVTAMLFVPDPRQYETGAYVRTNNASSHFSFTRLDAYALADGLSLTTIPVDFTKPEISSSTSGWATFETEFCKTPLMLAKQSVLTPGDPNYDTGIYMIDVYLGNRMGLGTGKGMHGRSFTEGVINMWQPDGYDGFFHFKVTPAGQMAALVNDFAPAIYGSPVYRDGDGFKQTGLNNNPTAIQLNNTAAQQWIWTGNPRFNGEIPYTILGNCAPVITTTPASQGFIFSFLGRYNEALQIDAANYNDSWIEWTDVQKQELGLPVCVVDVRVDGNTVISDLGEWDAMYRVDGVVDAEITNNNILVDGEIRGETAAVIHYDTSVGNSNPPTLTSMQIRDKDDLISDRLPAVDGCMVEMTAMDPTMEIAFEGDEAWVYYDTDPIKSVTVEYSAMGTGNWAPLEVEEVPELYYMPGFGYAFRASLETVSRYSANKWYDLRIRVTDNDGAWQEQTVSPAFRVEHVDSDLDTPFGYTPDSDAPAEYFNLQGMRVDAPQPGQVVICRRGTTVSKQLAK